MRTIYQCDDRHEAEELVSHLAGFGIRASVHRPGSARQGLRQLAGRSARWDVAVAPGDADPAAGPLGEWLELQRRRRGVVFHDLPPVVEGDGERWWAEWPHCPRCAERRQTVCPYCETPGSNFPLGDRLDEAPELARRAAPTPASGTLPLLVCTCCDEPFQPGFYRLCHGCGFAFHGATTRDAPLESELFSPLRVAVAAAGVLGTCGALAGYFWLLLR